MKTLTKTCVTARSELPGGLLFAVLAAVLLLGGCVHTGAGCPVLKTYTRAETMAVADELRKLPVGNPLLSMVKDYGQLRAACRTFTGQ